MLLFTTNFFGEDVGWANTARRKDCEDRNVFKYAIENLAYELEPKWFSGI